MSTAHPPSRPKTRQAHPQAVKIQAYVDRQIETTCRQVRSTDLLAGVLWLVVFVLAFLFVAAIIDAWIWPLNRAGRWLSLLGVIGGSVALLAGTVWPMLTRKINPDYAAKMIEAAKPGFRNSLLNYVALKRKPEQINPAVLDAVSRQAATDLSAVPEDETVDRSKLIRIGFYLVGLTTLVILYSIFSPKNPMTTVGRVLFPSAELSEPALVQISDIQPGTTKVFFGDPLEISATIRGSHQPEDVKLVYSTVDGQRVNQELPMTPVSGKSGRYRVDLAGETGVRQSLSYQILARDGESQIYEVVVEPKPAITIESIRIEPPAYTGLPTRTSNVGAVEAVEGSQVYVTAQANLPIDHAFIQLLREVDDDSQARNETQFVPVGGGQKMRVNGPLAEGRFQLVLDGGRKQPIASHYRIEFFSKDGKKNQRPNVYPIRIIADLAPEIKIQSPVESESTVPVNGNLPVVIEAVDLDYQISEVRLEAELQGRKLLSESLKLQFSDDNRNRAVATYRFQPAKLGLQTGDQVLFYATAADNRTAYNSQQQPDPNVTRSPNYRFVVTEADDSIEQSEPPQGQPGADSDAGNDDQPKSADNGFREPPEGAEDKPESEKPDQDSAQDPASDNGSSDPENSTDPEMNRDPAESSAEKDGGDGEAGNQQPNQQDTGSESENPKSGSDNAQPKDGEDPQQQEGGSGDSGSQSQSGGSDQGGAESADGGGGENSSSQNASDAGQSGGGNEGGSDSSNASSNGSGTSSSGTSSSGSKSQGNPSNQGSPSSEPSSSGAQNGSDSSSGGASQNAGEGGGSTGGGSSEGSPQPGQSDQPLSPQASDAQRLRALQEMYDQSNEEPGNQKAGDGDRGPGDSGADAQDSKSSGTSDQDSTDSDSGGTDGEGNRSDNRSATDSETGNSGSGGNTDTENQPPQGDGNTAGGNAEGTEDGNRGDTAKGSAGGGGDADENPQGQDPAQQPAEGGGGAEGAGNEGAGNEGAGNEGAGNEGAGNEGAGNEGAGNEGAGNEGAGNEGAGNEGAGNEGAGNEGAGNEGAGDEGAGKEGAGNEGAGNEGEADSQQPQDSGQGAGEGNQSSGNQGSSSTGSQSTSSSASGSESSSGASGNNASSSNSGGSSDSNSASGTQASSPSGNGASSQAEQDTPVDQQNLEHARKATDLILNRLSEQKNEPDPEVLKKLNMNQQDFKEFVERWEKMRDAAAKGDPQAQRRYERAIRSIGMRPESRLTNESQGTRRPEGLSEDGVLNEVRPELRREFDAFQFDLNRSDR